MRKCYVHLGKHGDLMILMPGWEREFKETGERPIVMVAEEFADTLEGCSYVLRWRVPLHWYGDCGQARLLAEKEFGKDNVIFPKWWDDPTFTPPRIRQNATQLIIHGKRMAIESGEWFSYMASQWKYAGFGMAHLSDCVNFDVRRKEVERHLRGQIFRSTKPKLLVCLNTGGSSPFPFTPEIEKMLYNFRGQFEIIDLMKVRANRIYDMLGLFDYAAGMLTTDTATLHLASASKIPYVAFIANGGGGSVPRGNCVLAVRYADTMKQEDAIHEEMIKMLNKEPSPPIEIYG